MINQQQTNRSKIMNNKRILDILGSFHSFHCTTKKFNYTQSELEQALGYAIDTLKGDYVNGEYIDNKDKITPSSISEKLIGGTLRYFRKNAGLSQTDVANSLGITFQQVQKYESGANRISSSSLFWVCGLFKISITEFYEKAERTI